MQCARVVWMEVQAHQQHSHLLPTGFDASVIWKVGLDAAGGDITVLGQANLLQHALRTSNTCAKQKKTCVKCNALRLPPPAYHMRKQTKQCTCSVLAPLSALAWDVGLVEWDISLRNALPHAEAHLETRRFVGASEIHARSRQCTTPPPQSKHPKEPRYNKTGCGYHRDLD